MRKPHPIALGLTATVLITAALVVALRAMIPAGDSALPAPEPAERREDNGAVVRAPTPTSAPALPTIALAPRPTPAPVIAEPAPSPTTPFRANANADASTNASDGSIESIRADLAALRARLDALTALGQDGGSPAHVAAARRLLAMASIPALLDRLGSAEPPMSDAVARYRAALADAGALDSAARGALRARIFAPADLERATLFEEITAIGR